MFCDCCRPHACKDDELDTESSSDEEEGIIYSTTRKQTLEDMDKDWSDHEAENPTKKKRKLQDNAEDFDDDDIRK